MNVYCSVLTGFFFNVREAAHHGRRVRLHIYFGNTSTLMKVPKVHPEKKIHPQLEKSRDQISLPWQGSGAEVATESTVLYTFV